MCHSDWGGLPPDEAARRDIALADGARMPAWHVEPDEIRGAPVVVMPDIYGPSPFYWEITRRLARCGHRAMLVDHHFREGPLTEHSREAAFARRESMDETQALRDLDAAIDSVGDRSDRVGVVGFCLAGQFALDLAAQRADLVTVGFYPFPEGVGGTVRVAAPRPVDLADEIRGPVLCFWGAEDYITGDVIDRFGAAMRSSEADYEAHVYPGAGHSFLQGLVEPRSDSAAAQDAWDRTVAFLSRGDARPAV